jgi:uncharacterized protein
VSGYTIIDADTHVTESADLWTSRAPTRMRDRVPHIENDADGSQKWVVGGSRPLASAGMTATAGVGSFNNPPKTFEEMHPGAYNAKGAVEVHGPNGHLGDGHVPKCRRVRGPAILEAE